MEQRLDTAIYTSERQPALGQGASAIGPAEGEEKLREIVGGLAREVGRGGRSRLVRLEDGLALGGGEVEDALVVQDRVVMDV